jgi:predicted nuclease with TOPRIM domain
MPHDTPKGWACDVCGEVIYYKDDCEQHEAQCRLDEANEQEARLDALEGRVEQLEREMATIREHGKGK